MTWVPVTVTPTMFSSANGLLPEPKERGSRARQATVSPSKATTSFFSHNSLSLRYPYRGCVTIITTDMAVITPAAALADQP